MISAQIIADSISNEGKRLTTMQLRYPKFIHGEFMTHRVFSRNASSSRAIPVKKLIEDIRREPAMPVYWGGHQKGMQAGEELQGDALGQVQACWKLGMEECIRMAEMMMEYGLHKQLANRIIEPWCHINVVVTATEWDNFYELRCHPDAQPEMRTLAETMQQALQASKWPTILKPGEWHLPYVTPEEHEGAYAAPGDNWPTLIKLSVARCARVSYLTHEGKPPNVEEDLKLYDRLVGSRPLHASPCEHQATPDTDYGIQDVAGLDNSKRRFWHNADEHGNFVGWRQFRKQLEKVHTI